MSVSGGKLAARGPHATPSLLNMVKYQENIKHEVNVIKSATRQEMHSHFTLITEYLYIFGSLQDIRDTGCSYCCKDL